VNRSLESATGGLVPLSGILVPGFGWFAAGRRAKQKRASSRGTPVLEREARRINLGCHQMRPEGFRLSLSEFGLEV
jgi:hypothetical protein